MVELALRRDCAADTCASYGYFTFVLERIWQ